MGRHGGRTKKKGQMGRGRALERQESDGEKAARGGCLPLSTLNEGGKGGEEEGPIFQPGTEISPPNFEERSNNKQCSARKVREMNLFIVRESCSHSFSHSSSYFLP